MENTIPLVSIVCTAYNHEPYIKQTLVGFVMQQSTFPIEIIVHDDASTDKTTEIIKENAKEYPDLIIPILQTENQYSKGFNIWEYLFMKEVKGKYIALCEGDDYWTDPNKLQKQVDFMEMHEEVSMCFHNAKIINAEGNKIGDCRRYNEDRYVPVEDIINKGGIFCPTASLLFRTQYIKFGYPDFCKNCHVGDYPLQLYLSSKGRVYYFDSEMAAYRCGIPGSWSQTFHKTEFSIKVKKWMSELEMLDGINALFNYKYSLNITKLQENYLIGTILLPNRDKKKEIRKIYEKWISKFQLKGKMKIFLIYHFYSLYHFVSKVLHSKSGQNQ